MQKPARCKGDSTNQRIDHGCKDEAGLRGSEFQIGVNPPDQPDPWSILELVKTP